MCSDEIDSGVALNLRIGNPQRAVMSWVGGILGKEKQAEVRERGGKEKKR